jgi:hypothetical protein
VVARHDVFSDSVSKSGVSVDSAKKCPKSVFPNISGQAWFHPRRGGLLPEDGSCSAYMIFSQRSTEMLRHSMTVLVVLLWCAGNLLAADKEVTGKLVKVNVKAKTLTVKTADGDKLYDVNDDTKFIGPKGGESKDGIKDERLVKGAELKLVVAGNNKTLREVHLPEKKKDKDK